MEIENESTQTKEKRRVLTLSKSAKRRKASEQVAGEYREGSITDLASYREDIEKTNLTFGDKSE